MIEFCVKVVGVVVSSRVVGMRLKWWWNGWCDCMDFFFCGEICYGMKFGLNWYGVCSLCFVGMVCVSWLLWWISFVVWDVFWWLVLVVLWRRSVIWSYWWWWLGWCSWDGCLRWLWWLCVWWFRWLLYRLGLLVWFYVFDGVGVVMLW